VCLGVYGVEGVGIRTQGFGCTVSVSVRLSLCACRCAPAAVLGACAWPKHGTIRHTARKLLNAHVAVPLSAVLVPDGLVLTCGCVNADAGRSLPGKSHYTSPAASTYTMTPSSVAVGLDSPWLHDSAGARGGLEGSPGGRRPRTKLSAIKPLPPLLPSGARLSVSPG